MQKAYVQKKITVEQAVYETSNGNMCSNTQVAFLCIQFRGKFCQFMNKLSAHSENQ